MQDSEVFAGIIISLVVALIVTLAVAIRILKEYERAVVFRLRRLIPTRGPGLILIIPVIERMVRINLCIITMDVQKQELMTRDNVPVTFDAVIYLRVLVPEQAVTVVKHFGKATSFFPRPCCEA